VFGDRRRRLFVEIYLVDAWTAAEDHPELGAPDDLICYPFDGSPHATATFYAGTMLQGHEKTLRTGGLFVAAKARDSGAGGARAMDAEPEPGVLRQILPLVNDRKPLGKSGSVLALSAVARDAPLLFMRLVEVESHSGRGIVLPTQLAALVSAQEDKLFHSETEVRRGRPGEPEGGVRDADDDRGPPYTGVARADEEIFLRPTPFAPETAPTLPGVSRGRVVPPGVHVASGADANDRSWVSAPWDDESAVWGLPGRERMRVLVPYVRPESRPYVLGPDASGAAAPASGAKILRISYEAAHDAHDASRAPPGAARTPVFFAQRVRVREDAARAGHVPIDLRAVRDSIPWLDILDHYPDAEIVAEVSSRRSTRADEFSDGNERTVLAISALVVRVPGAGREPPVTVRYPVEGMRICFGSPSTATVISSSAVPYPYLAPAQATTPPRALAQSQAQVAQKHNAQVGALIALHERALLADAYFAANQEGGQVQLWPRRAQTLDAEDALASLLLAGAARHTTAAGALGGGSVRVASNEAIRNGYTERGIFRATGSDARRIAAWSLLPTGPVDGSGAHGAATGALCPRPYACRVPVENPNVSVVGWVVPAEELATISTVVRTPQGGQPRAATASDAVRPRREARTWWRGLLVPRPSDGSNGWLRRKQSVTPDGRNLWTDDADADAPSVVVVPTQPQPQGGTAADTASQLYILYVRHTRQQPDASKASRKVVAYAGFTECWRFAVRQLDHPTSGTPPTYEYTPVYYEVAAWRPAHERPPMPEPTITPTRSGSTVSADRPAGRGREARGDA
jgi:hypothetical protein